MALIAGAAALAVYAVVLARRSAGYGPPERGPLLTRIRTIGRALNDRDNGWAKRSRIACAVGLAVYFGGAILGWWSAHVPSNW